MFISEAMGSMLQGGTMQSDGGAEIGAIIGMIFGSLIGLAIAVVMIASMWKIYVKAGQPGWACLVPVYNQYILVDKILQKPIWWLVLMLLPCTMGIWAWVVYIELAKRFGKGPGFGIGMVLLPIVFFPMLGFGKAQYDGSPAAAGGMPGGMPGGMNPYGGQAPGGYGQPPPAGGYGGPPQGGMPPAGGGYGGPPGGGGYGGPPGGMPPGGGYGGPPPGGMPPGGGYGGPPGGGYPPR